MPDVLKRRAAVSHLGLSSFSSSLPYGLSSVGMPTRAGFTDLKTTMQKTKEQHLIEARDQFRNASFCLAKAVIELESSGGFEKTVIQVTETIGDLTVSAEKLNTVIGR